MLAMPIGSLVSSLSQGGISSSFSINKIKSISSRKKFQKFELESSAEEKNTSQLRCIVANDSCF